MTPYQFGSCAEALSEFTESAEVINFSDAVTKLGLTEITSDAGKVVSISKYIETTEAATTAATTGETAGALGAVSVETAGGTATATGAVVGDSAAVIGLTPKTVLVMAVCSALGLEAGFVGTQLLVNAMTDSDTPIQWNPFTAGGEIITYFTEDGQALFPLQLIENIKDWLVDKGVFNEDFGPEKINTNSFIDFDHSTMDNLVSYITSTQNGSSYVGRYSRYLQEAYQKLKEAGFTDLGGLNIVYGWGDSLVPDFYTFKFESYAYSKIKGIYNATFDNAYKIWDAAINIDFENLIQKIEGSITIRANGTWYNTPSIVESLVSKVFYQTSGNNPFGLANIFNGPFPEIQIPKQPEITTWPDENPLPVTFPSWIPTPPTEIPTPTKEDPESATPVAPLKLPYPNTQLDPESPDLPQPLNQEDTQTEPNTPNDVAPLIVIPPITYPPIDDRPTPPTDDIGDTPPILPPTSGSDTGLVKIYNPTLNSLASFSQWLWSNNIFDNFSKLFQDPMQAIIGLNLLYATPTRGSDSNIIVGNLDSNVSSRTVSNQYIDIDCGSVRVNKYFNNVLDYINTEIQLYLPFIGIVNLSQREIVGKTVSVKYTVDVLTGSCLAKIFIGGQLLYNFTGNCAVQLPLSSANYSSIITGGIALAGGIAATVASGGALAPALLGGAGAAAGLANHQVERSGNLGSNAGAMGVKKPYLIITRNKPYNPLNYNVYRGYPANTTVKLSNCTGYTEIEEVHLSGFNATQTEKNEIESLLKGGIIL